MSYDRSAAITFARRFWNTSCDDGIIGIIGAQDINVERKKTQLKLMPPASWQVQFKRTPDGEAGFFIRPGFADVLFQPWAGLGDCAHFISRCLTAGGVRSGFEGVPALHDFLFKQNFTKTLADKADHTAAKRVIDQGVMKPGDVIMYIAPPGGELGGGYVHSAMFVSSNTITCHTICRIDEAWDAPHADYTFTLVHMSDDDPGPGLLDHYLSGWWDVTWRGTHRYYWFANGAVAATAQRPASAAPIHFATDHGYYFPDRLTLNSFKIFWSRADSKDRKNSVEAWTVLRAEGRLQGKLNDRDDVSAEKLSF